MYVVTELFPDRGEEAVLVSENECYVNQGITIEPSELTEAWLEDSKTNAQGIIDDIEHYFNEEYFNIDEFSVPLREWNFNIDEFSVPLREWTEEDERALEEELAQEEEEEEEEEEMDLREN
jgi:hypothetical protein